MFSLSRRLIREGNGRGSKNVYSSLGASSVNWNASSGNKWTIPLGGGVGKLFKIGNQAIKERREMVFPAGLL